MTFWTMLMIETDNMTGEEAAQAWIKRRCVEEAEETVSGFRHGEVMLSSESPNRICVMCGWKDESAYHEWVNSPVRDKQAADLSPVVSGKIETLAFRGIHAVSKPQARG